MVLNDNAPEKWELDHHSAAKHAVLARYMKAWLPILASGARRANVPADVVIVDGFAGRGRYRDGEPGSPIILRQIAADVVGSGRAERVEMFFIEKDPENHAALDALLRATPNVMGVEEHPPVRAEFAQEALSILASALPLPRPRASFWFIDPFGFSGIPLEVMRQILSRPRAEVFITLMVHYLNRFIEDPYKHPGIAETFGLETNQLNSAIADVRASGHAAAALRELYEQRLRTEAGAKYVWPFRVARAGSNDTFYYLIHGSTHPKALREMKKATYAVGDWRHSFLGADDVSITGQAELPTIDELNEDLPTLKRRLLETFGGQEIAYDPKRWPAERSLLNEACPDPRFFKWVDGHFKDALVDLIKEGRVTKVPVETKGQRGLAGEDRLRFPPSHQLSLLG